MKPADTRMFVFPILLATLVRMHTLPLQTTPTGIPSIAAPAWKLPQLFFCRFTTEARSHCMLNQSLCQRNGRLIPFKVALCYSKGPQIKTKRPHSHEAALKMFSEKYVERKLYRPTHLALLPMNARNSLETEEKRGVERQREERRLGAKRDGDA